jgi:hypothetical protein
MKKPVFSRACPAVTRIQWFEKLALFRTAIKVQLNPRTQTYNRDCSGAGDEHDIGL